MNTLELVNAAWKPSWQRLLIFGVLLSLTVFMSLRTPREYLTPATHQIAAQSSATRHRELQQTDLLNFAVITSGFVLPPSTEYGRQPVNARRALSPRRLPGAHYNRPPPIS